MSAPDPMDPQEQQRRFFRNLFIFIAALVIAGFVFYAASGCTKPEARYSATPTRVVVADSVLYQFVAIPAPARVDTIKVCYDVVMAVVECPVTPPPIDTTTTPPSAPSKPFFTSTAGGTSATVTATWARLRSAASTYSYHAGRDGGPAWSGASGTTAANSVDMPNVARGVVMFFCVKAVNAAGASADACNNYTVPSGTTPPPIDTTTPPPTDSSSHEPPGLTLIFDRRWDALNEKGWYDDNVPSKYSISADATAPHSPANVGQQTYPSGMGGGGSPAVAEKGVGNKQTLYVSYWVKLSSNWVGHSSGVNKQIFIWSDNQPAVYTSAQGGGSGRLSPEIRLQGSGGTVNLTPNVIPQYDFTRGVWHRWELVLVSNTSGQSNGKATWWIDGAKVGEYTTVRFNANTSPFATFQWSPIWGGTGGSIPSAQHMWMDHVYASGK